MIDDDPRPAATITWAPLAAVVAERLPHITCDTQLSVALGVSNRSLARWKATGQLGLSTAEDVCERFGLHPAQVWGQAAWNAVAFGLEVVSAAA